VVEVANVGRLEVNPAKVDSTVFRLDLESNVSTPESTDESNPTGNRPSQPPLQDVVADPLRPQAPIALCPERPDRRNTMNAT
jgi:hypothetical protein